MSANSRGPSTPNPTSPEGIEMSTHSIPAAHPMPAHTARRAVIKVAAGIALMAAASTGVYEGAQAVTAHMNAPAPSVSYASQSTIARTLAGAWHTPATAGDFRADASIQTPDVVSVVKVAN